MPVLLQEERDPELEWWQSLTTLSSCEAELVAAVTGVRLGLGVRQLLKELLAPQVTTILKHVTQR
eukprot:6623636-Prorocentrum_lima.AAC.1